MGARLSIEFHGAAGEVTGSCHLLRIGDRQVLLDCGMIQGGRRAHERNREDFPFDPGRIDAVVLSHAHIDHCGRLPLLVQRGFGGPIYAQAATRELCRIMLEDSARLAAADAETENRRRERKGLPLVSPLYSVADVERTLRQFVPLAYGETRDVVPGLRIRLQEAGHILGSACVEAWAESGDVRLKLVFSGDLGQYGMPILRDPALIAEADLVLMESTYGDRLHRDREATVAELAGILTTADHHRGNILIPAFAVGRSQELLYLMAQHQDDWQLSRWRLFLDSPMAIRATEVYRANRELYDPEAAALLARHEGEPLLPNLAFSETPDESQRINRLRSGAIIIAGSGMCEGGRILHHLKHHVWRPECHVVIVGYQAEGTLGRRLVDREPYVRIHHEAIRVRATIHTVNGLSAHGDQADLLRWYDGFRGRPPVFLVHGEPGAAGALAQRLRAAGAAEARLPARGETLDLTRLRSVTRA